MSLPGRPAARPANLATSWWIAMRGAGPGGIILGSLKACAGSFLAFFA